MEVIFIMKKICKKVALTLILTVLASNTVCPYLNPNVSSIYTKKYISPFAIPNTPQPIDEY